MMATNSMAKGIRFPSIMSWSLRYKVAHRVDGDSKSGRLDKQEEDVFLKSLKIHLPRMISWRYKLARLELKSPQM